MFDRATIRLGIGPHSSFILISYRYRRTTLSISSNVTTSSVAIHFPTAAAPFTTRTGYPVPMGRCLFSVLKFGMRVHILPVLQRRDVAYNIYNSVMVLCGGLGWLPIDFRSPIKCVVFTSDSYELLECGPMPNVMAALPNIGGALCSTPQFG